MSTTEEKLDNVLKALDSIKQEHAEGQRDLRRKLDRLEREVASGQEDATQKVVKRLKEDRTLVFKKNGNERQFLFNDNVKDQVDAAGKHLELLEPVWWPRRVTRLRHRQRRPPRGHSGRPLRRLERHVAARGGSLKLLSRDLNDAHFLEYYDYS